MPYRDEQLRTFGKALDKMQHESEKSFSRKRRKTRKQSIFFVIGIVLVSIGLFFLMPALRISFIQNLLAVLFLSAGLLILFFQSRRIYGVIVTFLSLIILAQIFAFAADYSFIEKDVLRYVLLFSTIVIGTVLLLISFFNKRHNDK